MKSVSLFDYQLDAVRRMKNGCILCGDVGSGKSRTALAYYHILSGGEVYSKTETNIKSSKPPIKKDLYIITTARKRDTKEWELEMGPFLMSKHKELNYYGNNVTIDSWNNIKKYADIKDSFFIFDEQRVVGNGVWVKSFLKIAKHNEWILLSATPGDSWMDYIPVFIANGFYKNRTEFINRHVIYVRGVSYPIVDRFENTGRLVKMRKDILINMNFKRKTVRNKVNVFVDYDISHYKEVMKTRWNPYKEQPIGNAAELCYVLRRVVNSHPSRIEKVLEILKEQKRAIIFYNFDYELGILRKELNRHRIIFAEWNGHMHQPVPHTEKWAYLVQYAAGSEGWNCVLTDTVIFYSQTYSYRTLTQSSGRIDRLNTPYTDLYFYHLKSRSNIDMAIFNALSKKKDFNANLFSKRLE